MSTADEPVLFEDKPDPDLMQLEDSELDTLVEKGMSFTLPKRSLLRYFGKTERTFLIQEPYLATLYLLSKEWIRLDVSLNRLNEDALAESKQLAFKQTIRCCRIIAIAYLNSRWKISLFSGLLAYYFSWRITPRKLVRLTILIDSTSNLVDFIYATRIMSASPRTTAPA